VSTARDYSASTLAAISLIGRSEGVVKRLRGFRKDRHTVPDAVNAATQAFLARLATDELGEEAETWFQRARAALDYKRRDLSLDLGAGTAVLTARDFTFEIAWELLPADPASYGITRTLHDVRTPDFVRMEACDRLFAGTFTVIVFTLARGVAVEAVIDAVEALPPEMPLAVQFPSSCAECTLTVPAVDAVVRCTGATLEMVFPRPGSPQQLLEAFSEVRAAFRLTRSEALASLL
jgi:hypothetical protein